jgi:hypothetical protein
VPDAAVPSPIKGSSRRPTVVKILLLLNSEEARF